MQLIGRVMDVRGRPIPGATLTIDDGPPVPPITTDAQGAWSLSLHEPPQYMLHIQVRADGFARWAVHDSYDKLPAESRKIHFISAKRSCGC